MNVFTKGYRKLKSLKLAEKMYAKYYEITMQILTNPLAVQFLSIKRSLPQNRSISLAITHYNRSKLIIGALRNVLQDERIDEVIIYDDCSSIEEFTRMEAKVKKLSPKITIYRGEKNLGPYKSKITAISKCKNEWAIILDSDNVLSKTYVDILYAIPTWDSRLIYCPTLAKPDFDFSRFDVGKIDYKKVQEIILSGQDIKLFRGFLNDGNYFLNVPKYVECAEENKNVSVRAADVLVFNYLWLKKGNGLYPVKDLSYYHRLHSGSYQMGTWRMSREIVNGVMDAIANNNNYEFPDNQE
ncbi:glycosyltransferase [Aerosakkonemataceae cyanobacterium BLCC-F50]|uniref:Glycosyltransferase n=1 Tax=Floridaenema flaviceps BLCC-F50 TaxID=3153642 RepID=A0ABV4XXD9_9CYAN